MDTSPRDEFGYFGIGPLHKTFFKQLPEKYQEAIETTELEGHSQKEFAEKSGLIHSAIKPKARRSRAMLKGLFPMLLLTNLMPEEISWVLKIGKVVARIYL